MSDEEAILVNTVVCAAEILFGAHVKIIVANTIQYSVNTCNRRDADWARWQTWVLVCVVWALNIEQIVVYSLQVKALPGKFNCWVGLQRHSLWIFSITKHQTVVVHSCNHRLFLIVGCFLVNNTCKSNYFVW